MPSYQILLTPADGFFFGGEKHDAVTEKSDYFVVSNYFPQQTTLLGLIRYYLLLKNNCLSPLQNGKQDAAIKLIGEKSFDYTDTEQSFGRINSISSLYFLQNGEPFYFSPLDKDYTLSGEGILQKNGEAYKAKDGEMKLNLQNRDGGRNIQLAGSFKDDAILYAVMQTGNEKADNGETKENAFYKQMIVKMKPGWCFAVDISLADELLEETLFIPFGGERCFFKMEIKPANNTHSIPFARSKPALYCVSDCFIKADVLNNTLATVNTIVPFRNLQSIVNQTQNYDAFGNKSTGQKRSTQYNLMGRGSVLYFNSEKDRDAAAGLFNQDHCTAIGFNHIIKSN